MTFLPHFPPLHLYMLDASKSAGAENLKSLNNAYVFLSVAHVSSLPPKNDK